VSVNSANRGAGELDGRGGVDRAQVSRQLLPVASKRYWKQLPRDLRQIYTAPNADAARAAFEELEEKRGTPYPAIGKLWRAAWAQFIPFLDYGACRRIA